MPYCSGVAHKWACRLASKYASDGFWEFLRHRYAADYIVVDAKNSKLKIKKKDVLQIANYLKAPGAGLFGMVFCRHGADANAMSTTIREHWFMHSELIVVLDDTDVERMLLASSAGGDPTVIIGERIQAFRLSL